MPEFVFVCAGRIPLGQKILADKLEEAGISTKIISLAALQANILDESGENSFFSKRKITEYKTGVDAYFGAVNEKIKDAKYFGMTFFDAVGEKEISLVISHAIKKYFPNSTLVAGGPAFNSMPLAFLKESGADYAIRGEAEKELPRLIQLLSGREKGNIREIPGIMFKQNKKTYSHPLNAKLTTQEVQNSKFTYVRDGNTALTYSERGCKNACIFCTVPRKGHPVMINTNTIIEGLKTLALDKQITRVAFLDDHFFADTKRANELLNEIIKNGLNKRFKFDCAATIESLLLGGKPNIALIRKIKRAGIVGIDIGTEALNNNMLRELKGNRYNKVHAIEVLRALQKTGIYTENYLLAGGINTRARDFMESYYTALRLEMKGVSDFYSTNMIGAIKGTPIYKTAEKEDSLFTMRGRKTKPLRNDRTGVRIAVPKDPALRELFLEKLRKREGRMLDSKDMDRIIKMGQESKDRKMQKYARKLQKIKGEDELTTRLIDKLMNSIRIRIVAREMKKRGLLLTNKNVTEFLKDQNRKQQIQNEAYKTYNTYINQRNALSDLKGIERLRVVQKMRKTTGIGVTFEFNPKKTTQKTRR